MMELFYEDGHLSREGLQALVDGRLDDMALLEAGEHLAYCDACTLQYTALLEEDVLQAPLQPLAPTVVKRLRQNSRRRLFARYATAVAAACLAVVMWGAGSALLPGRQQGAQQPAPAAQQAATPAQNGLSGQLNQFFGTTSQGLGSFFARLAGDKQAAGNTAALPTARQAADAFDKARAEREQVFDQKPAGLQDTANKNIPQQDDAA